jgi:hypothetical protein
LLQDLLLASPVGDVTFVVAVQFGDGCGVAETRRVELFEAVFFGGSVTLRKGALEAGDFLGVGFGSGRRGWFDIIRLGGGHSGIE